MKKIYCISCERIRRTTLESAKMCEACLNKVGIPITIEQCLDSLDNYWIIPLLWDKKKILKRAKKTNT